MNTPPTNSIIEKLKEITGTTTDKDLAVALNIKPGRLQIWRHRDMVNFKEIISFCIAYGHDLNYVFQNTNLAVTAPCHPETDKYLNDIIVPPSGYIPGIDIVSQQIVDPIHFSKEWAHHYMGTDPNDLLVVKIADNNMTPWITAGGLVVVNLKQTSIVSDDPYVLYHQNTLIARRIHNLTTGYYVVYSDAPFSKEHTFAKADLPIIVGRIVCKITN